MGDTGTQEMPPAVPRTVRARIPQGQSSFKSQKHDRLYMPDLPGRNRIAKGVQVSVETKKNQGTGRLTDGIVEEVLTASETHPHGIKVRLKGGQVGRVKIISPARNSKDVAQKENGAPPEQVAKFVDLDRKEIPRTEDKDNEFKEFYQYNKIMDMRMDAPIKRLKYEGQQVIATAICSFGNSRNGGFIYLGIGSDGTIMGLEKDKELELFPNYSDSFANHMRDNLYNFIQDKVFMTSKMQMKFREVDGKTICIIQVLPSHVPLWRHDKNVKTFFVRGAVPRAEKLNSKEQIRYILERFPNYK